MLRLDLPGPDDAAEIVDALLAAADRCETSAPELAARRRTLAEHIGDGLDALPRPTHHTD
ncbi:MULTISPECIES: hypothetical protein [Streptomyces]|uniref:hypothetical protein n=1 Tax=Streptomyces lycopersici TaxID=2974589 RepID=UPI0021D35A75|nr:hypothetical protein [Streptomyces sp. NEAU-383]